MLLSPVYQALSRSRYSALKEIVPSCSYVIQALGLSPRSGRESMNVSTPKVSHIPGRISCRARAIEDFPELDPPFSTIAWGIRSGDIQRA